MKTVFLEDNNEYVIIGEIVYGAYNYLYLVDANNPKSFCIRKEEVNNRNIIYGLDSQLEFDEALDRFANRRIEEV